MTVIEDTLWEEDEGPADTLVLPYGLAAFYERNPVDRAVRWAAADHDRWKRVMQARRNRSQEATDKAALKVYEDDKRERLAYVQQLLERGRAV